MLRPIATASAVLLALARPVAAEPRADVDRMVEALGLPALMEVMQEEGLGYGQSLRDDLLQGRGGAGWAETVAAIYDTGRMQAMVSRSLEDGLTPEETAGIAAFFQGETGRQIVAQELAARQALLDEEVEAAAREVWHRLESEGGARWDRLVEFAEVNDLIESNVAGAMTASYAFYRGMAEGGAFGGDLSEEQILTDVWNREAEIRDDTVDWVYSFTSLAYQPLSEEEFDAYIAFSRTETGQAMNAALFTAFNDLFTVISRDLGRGAAQVLAGEDI